MCGFRGGPDRHCAAGCVADREDLEFVALQTIIGGEEAPKLVDKGGAETIELVDVGILAGLRDLAHEPVVADCVPILGLLHLDNPEQADCDQAPD